MLAITGVVRVLLVSVSEPAKVANVPVVGSVTPVFPETVNVVAKLPEIASVLATLFATPVPPLFAGKVPVTFDAKLTKVVDVDPVPPEVIGSADPRVKEVKYEAASTTFVPLLKTNVALPAGTDMPVPEVFLTVLAPVPVLLMR
jgi:hypothetical protein